jgi:type IV secretory pathway TraG/TraD family ATPase VirD4
MKFRVKPKDLVIFIIFCIFLLILSSLAVLNVTSLLNTSEFFGLNFFKGLVKPYLLPTLVVFFAVLVSIFLSVSSYIFERDKSSKGLGFSFKEKEEKGYSRWAKPNEIKNDKDVEKVIIKEQTSEAGGMPLINDGKNIWVDNGEYHSLVIGATGSGKSSCVVNAQIQTLARHGESIIVTDPKGELYRDHSEFLRDKGYKIIVLNFRNPNLGNAWNPLTLPYQLYKEGNTDKAVELLDDVAHNILYDPNNKNDPFWEKSASDFFSGLALGLFQDAKEEQINLNSINYMSTVGEENFATSNYTKEYFTLKGEDSNTYVFASNTINAPNETKGSILSVFRQKIRLFATKEELSEMLSYSDFNMREIGTQKTAVFMIIHDEKTTYHALATIFLKQLYETLIDVAQTYPKGKLPFKTNFILDEFANMPPLKDVTTMVTAARSRAIRFTFIIQNFAQLNDVYGKEQAETIRSNCGNIIYLITTELAALEEISKLCGEVKSKEKDKTASTPLITVSDLQKLQMFEVIILRSRLNPFRTKMTPSFEIDWGHEFGNGKLVERERHKVELFDIKEFVKVQKRNKLFEALDNNNAKNNSEPKPSNEKSEDSNNEITNLSSDFNSTPAEVNSLNPFGNFNNKHPDIKNQNNDDLNELNDNQFSPFFSKKIETSAVNIHEHDSILNPNNESSPKQTSGKFLNDFNNDTNDTEIDTLDDKDFENTNNEFTSPKFDIDNLVKRIDAQIAKLEEEEKAKNKNTKPETLDVLEEKSEDYDKLDMTSAYNFNDLIKEDKSDFINEEPTINIDKDSVVVGDITDDQYYDDFFNDDDNS